MSSLAVEPTRRRLTAKQGELVQRLLDAASAQLREHRYEGLTVRNVARQAGVAPATAYTYFASKDHLVAEIFWRRLRDLPRPAPADPTRSSPAQRVAAALHDVGAMVASEPELAAAATVAVLATDPDVKQLRDRMGADFTQRIEAALGPDADPRVVGALGLAYSGALLQAGMGHLRYDELADQLASVAALILEGDR